MYRRYFAALLLLIPFYPVTAQQFIGMPQGGYTGIQNVPYNPAWVNNARTGVEVNLYGVSIYALNNAYGISNRLLFNPSDSATENIDYFKLKNSQNKKAWVNADILGPSFSFTYKKKYQFGVYSRFRTVVSAGNVPPRFFEIITNERDPDYFDFTTEFKKTGATAHAFGEIGISGGQLIRDDQYRKIYAGVTLKYIMGFAGMSVYTKKLAIDRNNDTFGYIKGDLTAQYTFNTNPSSIADLQQRAGKGSLGLDIGGIYEYYGDVDPNKPAEYKFSLAASITDLGSARYVADKGSAVYAVNVSAEEVNNLSFEDEDKDEYGLFADRKKRLGDLAQQKPSEKFSIGLPTALRVNFDYNFGSNVYVAVNTLVNLRGNNGKVFKPGYTSYLNITPRLQYRNIKLCMPMTFLRFRTFTFGTIFNLGPFYIGSTSSLSSILLGSNITHMDFFTGFTVKFSNKERKEELRTFDYRGQDDPNRGFRKLLPRFMRSRSKWYYY